MPDYKLQSWVNADGTLDGRPVLVRKNASLTALAQSAYPFTLIVNLIYHTVRPDGMPGDDDELERLSRTEELLADSFTTQHDARFGLVVTGDGTRDLFLFLASPLSEESIEYLLAQSNPEVDYDFSVFHDPTWHTFNHLLPDTTAADEAH